MSKKLNWAYFGAKIKIYGHDQNIWSPEKFCISDVEHFGSISKKMDRLSQKNAILAMQGFQKMDIHIFW